MLDFMSWNEKIIVHSYTINYVYTAHDRYCEEMTVI